MVPYMTGQDFPRKENEESKIRTQHKRYRLFWSRSEDESPSDRCPISTFEAEPSDVVTAGTIDPINLPACPENGVFVLEDSQGEVFVSKPQRIPSGNILFANVRIPPKEVHISQESLEARWISLEEISEKMMNDGNYFGAVVLCEAVIERFIRDLSRRIFELNGLTYKPFERVNISNLNSFLSEMRIINKTVYQDIEKLRCLRNNFMHRSVIESYSEDPAEIQKVLKNGWKALNSLWSEIQKHEARNSSKSL